MQTAKSIVAPLQNKLIASSLGEVVEKFREIKNSNIGAVLSSAVLVNGEWIASVR